MEALVRAEAVGCSAVQSRMAVTAGCTTARCAGESSVQCGRLGGRKMVALRVLDRLQLHRRSESIRRPIYGSFDRGFSIRAASQSGGNVDEKVREITSEEAVEGPGNEERNAKLKADELKSEGGPEGESTELPVAAELLLSALKEEDESAESVAVEQDAVLDVASTSAVEDPKEFFKDVNADAKALAADLGRSLEDEAVGLETKAEELEDRQVKEADVVKKLQFHEDGTISAKDDDSDDGDGGNGGQLPSTRSEAEQKIVDTARDGYEVLKWAAEGIASAGQKAPGGLEIAREALDKRLKSFGIAADETKDVSSQVAEVAQKKLETVRGSASKFGEEFQVNIEEKKAAESLKPESERSPLTKVTQQVQENFNKATTGDGPLAQLNESLSENFSKASQAGQEFATRVSERAAEISDQAKERAGEFNSSLQNRDANKAISRDYEDERGNEQLQGLVSNKDEKTTLKFDIDEAQAVPSKKQDESDVGPDE